MKRQFKYCNAPFVGKYDCAYDGECENCEFVDMCGAAKCKGAVPDFVKDATNVYRTKNYIVKQQLIIKDCGICGMQTFTSDTFYVRTPEREEIFNKLFKGCVFPEGKRLPATAYVRTYIK